MGTGKSLKQNLQKTHFVFGNDFPEKKSSYCRDFGPETKILDAIQLSSCRPQSSAEVLPVIERNSRMKFLTSHKQDFGHYNKEINSKLYNRCLQEFEETKQFHHGAKVINFFEKLPPLTRSVLDYRATKIPASCNTPAVMKSISLKTKNKCPFEPKKTMTEAMNAFQWPKQERLSPTLTRRYPVRVSITSKPVDQAVSI